MASDRSSRFPAQDIVLAGTAPPFVTRPAFDHHWCRPAFRDQQLGIATYKVDEVSHAMPREIDVVDPFCQPACYSNPHARTM
jgi:hypothetical protein